MTTCKGHKKDGTPCRSPIVLDNAYCRGHQDQAPETTAPEQPIRWTRECLEAAIAAHGGPEGLNLAGADLSDLDLARMNLSGIVLSRWDKDSKKRIGANLQGASLQWANFQGANLIQANLQEARLVGAKLQEAYLGRANLQEADLRDAELQGADLRDAELQGSILVHANLQRARLGHEKLQGAILGRANLQEAYLWFANLQEAYLVHANLQGARLRQAKLQGADLRDAELQGAVLAGANLQEADLWGADLQGTFFSGAWLDHTQMARDFLGPAIGEELARDYTGARDAYLRLKQNFDDLGDYAASSWAYRKERRMEKLEALQRGKKAWQEHDWKGAIPCHAKAVADQLMEWVCDYGEGIWRVAGSLIAVWVAFALIYGLIAGVWGPWQDTSSGKIRYITRNPIDLLAFSLGAMTTVAPIRLEARSMLAMSILTPLEALLGIFFAGLLGFVAGNRIRRS